MTNSTLASILALINANQLKKMHDVIVGMLWSVNELVFVEIHLV